MPVAAYEMGAASPAPDDETTFPKATGVVSICAFLTIFWSIFTEPHKTFAARILLFQPAWLFRLFSGDGNWLQDLGLVLGLHAIYSLCTGAWKLYTIGDIQRSDLESYYFRVYLQIFALLGVCGVLAGLIVHRGQQLRNEEQDAPHHEQRIDESLLPPLLITSRTSHSRLFPKKHAFSYSYLFAGVPVGSHGRVGRVLSVDSQTPAWFDVRSEDYLRRSEMRSSLGEKLKRYLHSEGVTDRDYAFAYLVTSPRFLGYSFNPVSFWYIYDSDTNLKYMVLEVNNTFDERRLYLLRASNDDDKATAHDWQGGGQKTQVFTDTWTKDFHVSPFNSRKGSYSLKALDPVAAFQETGHVKIDNTITMNSSKDHPKIVARVYSEGVPVDPHRISPWQLARFIAAWWWVTFATFPRIVWEAQKLFFRRKLHVWYRPEVTDSSIGRTYTDDERILEEFFRSFLTDVVEHGSKALRVIYEPAHNEGEETVLYSPGFTYEEDHMRTLTIKILSPSFYSRFVHYAHAKEAFDRECLTTDEKNRTLTVSGAHALSELVETLQTRAQHKAPQRQSTLETLRWNLLRRLRCPPAVASYPSHSGKQVSDYSIQDIRTFHFSELDRYAQQTGDAATYRRIAVKLFLAERYTFGLPVLVTLAEWTFRSVLVVFAMAYADAADAYDVLRPRDFVRADLWKTSLVLGAANTVHFWSFVKG